ncbi:hypothetical protein Esti_004676 [Eimeria stiedai]
MPAESWDFPVFRLSSSRSFPESPPFAFPAAPRKALQGSTLYFCGSDSSSSRKSSSGRSSGRSTSSIDAAFPADEASASAAATAVTTKATESAELSTAATAATTATEATAATAAPPRLPPSVTAAVAIRATAAAAEAATTKAPASKAAQAALQASRTTRAATTATPTAAKKKGSVSTQLERKLRPSRPACVHAICCGILPLSEESSREAGSFTCHDSVAGAIAAGFAICTSAADSAAAEGTGADEAEAAAESPLLRRGYQQADGLEDLTGAARVRRTIITPTRAERLGARTTPAAEAAATAAAIARGGFASRKRRRHDHQREKPCSLNTAAAVTAAAVAAMSCSSLQRSRSPPLLPAVSVPLLQQPGKQQQKNPCVVASESQHRDALRAASTRAATELPRAAVAEAAFHADPASPQRCLSYRRAFTSLVAVNFADAEGQEAYNAASIAAEAKTVAARAAARCPVNFSAVQANSNIGTAAQVTATGHSQLQQTNNNNATPLAAAASTAGASSQLHLEPQGAASCLVGSAFQKSITATNPDLPALTAGCSALIAAGTSKRTGAAIAKRTGPAATKECVTVPCQVSSLNSDPKWLSLLQRLQRRAAKNCFTNVQTQAHSSPGSSTCTSKWVQQAWSSPNKKPSNRGKLGSPRRPRQQHQHQQQKAHVQRADSVLFETLAAVAALRRSLLQHQMKAQGQQKPRRLLAKNPSIARQPGLPYSSYCSRCSGTSSRAKLKAAPPKQERRGSSCNTGTSSGSISADQKTLHADSGTPSKGRDGSAGPPEESRSSFLPRGAAGTQRALVTDSRRSSSCLKSAEAATAGTRAAAAVTSFATPYTGEEINCDGESQAAAAAAAAANAAEGVADAAATVAAATVVRAATVAAKREAASTAVASPVEVAALAGAAAQTSLRRPKNGPLTSETHTRVKCSSSKSSSMAGHGREVNFGHLQHFSRRGRCVGCKSSEQQQQEHRRWRPLSGSAKFLIHAGDKQKQILPPHSSGSHSHRPHSADSGFGNVKSKRSLAAVNSASIQARSAVEGKSGTSAVAYAGAGASATEPQHDLKMQLPHSMHPRKLLQTINDAHQQQQSRYRDKLAKMRLQLQEQQLLLQEQQQKHPLQRPPWNKTTSIAAGEAGEAHQVYPQPRCTTKLPDAAAKIISARLYERARQHIEIRELRRQLHQQQQQLILLQGQYRDLPGRLPGCHSNSSNTSSKRGFAAERKSKRPIWLQHESRVLQQLQQVSLQQQQQQREQRLRHGRSSRNRDGLTGNSVSIAESPRSNGGKDLAAQKQHHLQAQSDSMSSMRQHSALTQQQQQQEKDSCGAHFAPESNAADIKESNSTSRASSSNRGGASCISSDREHFSLKGQNDHEQQQQEQRQHQHQLQPHQLHSLYMHILRLHLGLQDQTTGPRKLADPVLSDHQQQEQQDQQQLMLLHQQKQLQNKQLLQLQQYLKKERLLHQNQRDMRHHAQQLHKPQKQIQQLQEERLQEKLHQQQMQLRKTLHCEQQQRASTTAAAAPEGTIRTRKLNSSLCRARTSVQSAPLNTMQSNSLSLNGQCQVFSWGAVSAASAPQQVPQQFPNETAAAPAAAAVVKLGRRKPSHQFDSSTSSEGEFRDSAATGHSMQQFALLDELQQQLQPRQRHQMNLASRTVDIEGAQQCMISSSESERQQLGAALSCSSSSRPGITHFLTKSHLKQQQQHKQKHIGHPLLTAGDPTSLLLQLRKLYGDSNAQQQQEQQRQEEHERASTPQAPCLAELRDVQERSVAALLHRQFVQRQKQQQRKQQQKHKPQPAKLTFGHGTKAQKRPPLASGNSPRLNSIPAIATAVRADLSTAGAKESKSFAAGAVGVGFLAVKSTQPAGSRRCDTSGLCSEGPVMSRQQQQRHQPPPQQHQPAQVIRGSGKACRSQQALQRSSTRSSPTAAAKLAQQPQQSQELQQQQQEGRLQLQIEKDGRLRPSLRNDQQQQHETSHEQQQPCPELRTRLLITSQQQSQRQLQQMVPLTPTIVLKTQRGPLGLSQQQPLLLYKAVNVPKHQQEFLHDLDVTLEQRQRLHVIHRRHIPH